MVEQEIIKPEWIHYVDDSFTSVKNGEKRNVLSIIDTFHKDIKFIYELENNYSISFLDVQNIQLTDN